MMGIKAMMGGQAVTFTSAAGQVLECDLGALNGDIRAMLQLHGLKQKVGDAAALGAGSSDADKVTAMTAVWEMLVAGDWSKRGEGDGGGEAVTVEAMARVTGATLQQAREVFEGLDKKAQAAMRKDLAGTIAEIQAERAAAKPVKAEAASAAAKALEALRSAKG